MTTILVGTDTTAAADLAVEDAARLARARGAELLVLYVRPDSETCARWLTRDSPPDAGGYLAAHRRALPRTLDARPGPSTASPPRPSARSRPRSGPTRS